MLPNVLYILVIILCQVHEQSTVRIRGLQIIPERAVIIYTNPKYMENVKMIVRRSSRGGSYVFHISGTSLQTWANNVTLSISMFEFLHNEYKPTFINVHYKFCDFINLDQYLGKIIKEHGIVCPLPKGYHELVNGTIVMPSFSYVFPIEKGKGDIVIRRLPTEEVIVRGEMFVTVKQF